MGRTRRPRLSHAGPSRDRERVLHSYTNHTTRSGAVVTKSYRGPDASRRCAHEAAVLTALSGRLPVPPVLNRNSTASPGSHARRARPGNDRQRPGEPVLRACGQMLRRVHAIDPGQAHAADDHHRDSAVLVHGDYGPQNCLLGGHTVPTPDSDLAIAWSRHKMIKLRGCLRLRDQACLEAWTASPGPGPAASGRSTTALTPSALGLRS